MTDLNALAEHVFNALVGVVGEDLTLELVQEAFASYSPKKTTKSVASSKAVPPSSKTVSKSKTSETHTCEYVINGKDGNQRVCGKSAKNELSGSWYCGTENSGHYQSMLAKAPVAKKSKAVTPAPKSKAVTPAPKSKAVAAKAPKSLPKVIKKIAKINLDEISPGLWVDEKNHRMVYTQDPREVYGVLDEDDETVLPITEEAASFAEAHGIIVRAKKVAKKTEPKSKAVAPKVAPKAEPKSTPKAVPKAKATKGKVESEEEVSETPVEEVESQEVEDVEDVEIDLADEEPQEEAVVDEEEPDVEEVDEGGDEEDVEEEEEVEEEE